MCRLARYFCFLIVNFLISRFAIFTGWEHYERHHSEHNVLLFRRPRATDPKTGTLFILKYFRQIIYVLNFWN